MVRPFTLGRLADVVRLAHGFRGFSPEQVEEAMMVSYDRAVELLRQGEEMKLLKVDGGLYYSTGLGSMFLEAFKNNDRDRLDEILCEYPLYLSVKRILMEKSVSVGDLKGLTGLNEVGVEIVLRLLQFVRDDLCSMDEKFFIKRMELPRVDDFLSVVRRVYSQLSQQSQWGQPRRFVRADKVAVEVCGELRISLDGFARLLDQLLESTSLIEIYSEFASYQFMPFSQKRVNNLLYRKCFIRLRE